MFPAHKVKTLIIIVFGFLIVSAGAVLLLPRFLGPQGEEQVNLTYWGFWDPEAGIKSLIEEYQANHPNVTIKYERRVPQRYRETLQARLSNANAPDIFRFHRGWFPMLKNYLASVPNTVYDSPTYESLFYPVVKNDLSSSGKYYGLPLQFDGLALVYNTEMLKDKGLDTPPATWDKFREYALTLTQRETNGALKVGGAALGTVKNVEYFSDIVGLMMLQNGVEMIKEGKVNFDKSFSKDDSRRNLGADALAYYILFSNTDKVWDESLPPSIEAFAKKKAAMIFVPASRIADIVYLSQQNAQDLKFRVAPVPQLGEGEAKKVAWASYWAEGVSKSSKHQAYAWDFLKFLSEKESLRKLYEGEKGKGRYGEPFSRVDMAEVWRDEPYLGAYLQQAPYAQSWYSHSQTQDNGLNDEMSVVFKEMVEAAVNGGSLEPILNQAATKATEVLAKYGLVTSSTTF
jgi:multiple sugar transport system substrate-binding protein